MTGRDFLDEVYRIGSPDAARDLYDDWSETYDATVTGAGYVTPARIAAALGSRLTDRGAPILDFGCGTGLAGRALHEAGYTTLDGCDLSEGMLAMARARGIYRDLTQIAAGSVPPARDHAAIVACGVVSKGAAPPETLELLVDALSAGAWLAFSFNDHTFEDPRFMATLDKALTEDRLRLHFREDGPHLPHIGLRSTVFVAQAPRS